MYWFDSNITIDIASKFNLMFYILYLQSVLSTVACVSYRSEPSKPHVQALDHFKDFLHDVQQQIRYGQYLLDGIDAEIPPLPIHVPNTATISTNYADRKGVAPIAVSGYFSDSFERFFQQTITKDPDDVMKVLQPGISVAASMLKNGQLKLLQGPMKEEFLKFLIRLFNDPYDDLKSYLTSLYKHMQNRAELCNAELNYIINHANLLVEKEDGEHLSKVIDEFENFPEGDKTGEQLCEHILEAFLRPFQKKEGTIELNRLYLYASGVIVLQRQGEGGFTETVASARRNGIPVQQDVEELNKADIVLKDLQETIKESQYLINGIIQYSHITTTILPDYNKLSNSIAKSYQASGDPPLFGLGANHETVEPPTEYLSEAYIIFFQQIVSKHRVDVMNVLKHMKTTINTMQSQSKLRWLGKNLTKLLNDLASTVVYMEYKYVQKTATMLVDFMQNRRKKLAPEYNEAIDTANAIITREDGEHLLRIMKEFKAYPNVPKSGEKLCKDIIEALSTPYEKVASTEEFKIFMRHVYELTISSLLSINEEDDDDNIY